MKVSELAKDRYKDPAYMAMVKEANAKGKESGEYKEKISSSLKERWKDPEYRQRMTKLQQEGKLKKKLLAQSK